MKYDALIFATDYIARSDWTGNFMILVKGIGVGKSYGRTERWYPNRLRLMIIWEPLLALWNTYGLYLRDNWS